MEEQADFGRQKSINDILQRAKEERNKAINTINFLLNYKIPSVFLSSQNIQNSLNDISDLLNINLESNENIEELKNSFISKLNLLKQQLQDIEITEEEVLSSTVIGDSYTLLREISQKLDVIPGKILANGKNQIISQVSKNTEFEKNQNDIKSKKIELEKQEMYLKGMLEATILPKKKKELEEKIIQVRIQIENLDKKLTDINSFGNNGINSNKSNYKKKQDIEFE